MRVNRRSFVSSAAGIAAAQTVSGAQQSRQAAQLNVAACQILTFPDVTKSAEKICSWIEKAAKQEIDVVAFPEAALCGYASGAEFWKTANPRDFEAAEATVIATARRLNIAVILGSAHWDDGKVFNSLLVIDRGGRVRGRYAKTYLAEGWPSPGKGKLPVYQVAGAKSCFIVCHDVRYPELVRLPAIAGAQICYLCSNESGLVEEHKLSAYRAMPIARATENGIYLVMANAPADSHNMHAQEQSHGNSKIVHPNGTVLVEAGFFKETLVSSIIDLKAADRGVARRSVNEGTIVSAWLRDGSRLVQEEDS